MTHFKRKERGENLRLILTRTILRISRIWTKLTKWEKYKLEGIKYFSRWASSYENKNMDVSHNCIFSRDWNPLIVGILCRF